MNVKKRGFETKTVSILKNKYDYLRNYLSDCNQKQEKILKQNKSLKQRLMIFKFQSKKIQRHSSQSIENEQNVKQVKRQAQEVIKSKIRNYKQEQRHLEDKINEIHLLINQYKKICQQTIKIKANNNPDGLTPRTNRDLPWKPAQKLETSSFLDSQPNQNQNSINLSMARNKSYQNIKTKIKCEICLGEYKPNEYYQHIGFCHSNMKNKLKKEEENVKKVMQSSKSRKLL